MSVAECLSLSWHFSVNDTIEAFFLFYVIISTERCLLTARRCLLTQCNRSEGREEKEVLYEHGRRGTKLMNEWNCLNSRECTETAAQRLFLIC